MTVPCKFESHLVIRPAGAVIEVEIEDDGGAPRELIDYMVEQIES